jgi:hypothetical protein
VHHGFAWCYVDGAVEPMTGARFCLERPDRNAAMFPRCLDAFAAAFPSSLKLLLRDTSGAHTAERWMLPEHVGWVCLPPYGPARNPLARVWRDRKEALAWLPFAPRDGQHDDVAELLRTYANTTLQALTGSTSLVEAMHALYA